MCICCEYAALRGEILSLRDQLFGNQKKIRDMGYAIATLDLISDSPNARACDAGFDDAEKNTGNPIISLTSDYLNWP